MQNDLWIEVDDGRVERAFRVAVGDMYGNIQPWRGASNSYPEAPCLLAGLDYDRPWTRDAALNCWYAGSLIAPEYARNTLLSVLTEEERGPRIGGQYWDAVVWATGAWHHRLCTGDRGFLEIAFSAVRGSLAHLEDTELDPHDGLFRGGACFQDGIAGYPDQFADGPTACILDWVEKHPREKADPGYGLPMKALSTNCLYYNAYRVLTAMAEELREPADPAWAAKARRLREAINRRFWIPHLGLYRYLVDADDPLERQEGFGHAFAVLFGVADGGQTAAVFENVYVTQHGIPCVWPTYERYANAQGTAFGRHSGTVWPQVNAAWAMAAALKGRPEAAWLELASLAEKACRDGQFAEIYHPLTGEIYGGLQESPPGSAAPLEWRSCRRQTWSAAGYIQMVLSLLFGLRIGPRGVGFSPYLPAPMSRASISGLRYRAAVLDITVERSGRGPAAEVNGEEREEAIVYTGASGRQSIILRLPKGGTP